MLKELELLGYPVKDRVTGFEGVCTNVGFDLYGCIQCIVVPVSIKFDKDDNGGRWFDHKRLVKTSNSRVMEPPNYEENAVPIGPESKPPMPKNPLP